MVLRGRVGDVDLRQRKSFGQVRVHMPRATMDMLRRRVEPPP